MKWFHLPWSKKADEHLYTWNEVKEDILTMQLGDIREYPMQNFPPVNDSSVLVSEGQFSVRAARMDRYIQVVVSRLRILS